MKKERYFYPVVVRTEGLKPFKIGHDAVLRPIKAKEREEFFGLKKIDFVFQDPIETGFVAINKTVASKKKGRLPYSDIIKGTSTVAMDILASNYVLVLNCVDSPNSLLEQVNWSLKLFSPTSTGGFLGFQEGETDVSFHDDTPLCGPYNYLETDGEKLPELEAIFSLVSRHYEDAKFSLIADLYNRALSGENIEYDARFCYLTTALEYLYLPEQFTKKLTKKLCTRVSCVLDSKGFGIASELFDQAHNLYGIRNEIVHEGCTTKLTGLRFGELVDIVRASLLYFLEDKSLFDEDNLKNLRLQVFRE